MTAVAPNEVPASQPWCSHLQRNQWEWKHIENQKAAETQSLHGGRNSGWAHQYTFQLLMSSGFYRAPSNIMTGFVTVHTRIQALSSFPLLPWEVGMTKLHRLRIPLTSRSSCSWKYGPWNHYWLGTLSLVSNALNSPQLTDVKTSASTIDSESMTKKRAYLSTRGVGNFFRGGPHEKSELCWRAEPTISWT